MEYSELINEDLISLDIKSTDRFEAIKELSTLLTKQDRLSDEKLFIKDIFDREKTMSTYCGNNIAIPHAISNAVLKPTIVFGKSKGFCWEEDDETTNFIILLAVPNLVDGNNNTSHIDMLSSIAELALDDDVVMIWQKATNKKQILESLLLTQKKK